MGSKDREEWLRVVLGERNRSGLRLKGVGLQGGSGKLCRVDVEDRKNRLRLFCCCFYLVTSALQ